MGICKFNFFWGYTQTPVKREKVEREIGRRAEGREGMRKLSQVLKTIVGSVFVHCQLLTVTATAMTYSTNRVKVHTCCTENDLLGKLTGNFC